MPRRLRRGGPLGTGNCFNRSGPDCCYGSARTNSGPECCYGSARTNNGPDCCYGSARNNSGPDCCYGSARSNTRAGEALFDIMAVRLADISIVTIDPIYFICIDIRCFIDIRSFN